MFQKYRKSVFLKYQKCRKSVLESLKALLLLRIGQQSGDYAEQRQECAHLEDVFDAGLVGEPSEERRTDAAQSEHKAEEDAGDESYFVGHEVGGVDHYRGERRGDDESREEGEHDGPRQTDVGHGEGERSRAKNGEPYHVLASETVAEHAASERADGEGGEEHEEAYLRSLHRDAELVDEVEREVARDAGCVEVFREDEQDEYEQCAVLCASGDVRVQHFRLARMLHGILQAGFIPRSEAHHDECCEQGGYGEPRYGVLSEGQDDERREQRTERRTAVAAHLKDRLRKTLLAARRQLSHARRRRVEHGRAKAHDAHSQQYEQIVLGERKHEQSGEREAHADGERIGARMAVGRESGEGLQNGGCHLKDERYDTYLREREVELVLEDRIDRRNDRLYHVVQKVRYATDDEHVIDRALCHGRVAFKDAAY